jgi:hypothetical protein
MSSRASIKEVWQISVLLTMQSAVKILILVLQDKLISVMGLQFLYHLAGELVNRIAAYGVALTLTLITLDDNEIFTLEVIQFQFILFPECLISI